MNTRTSLAAPTFVVVSAFCMAMLSSPSASAAVLSGRVQLGGSHNARPLERVKVTLYEATDEQPIVIGQSKTDRSGQFKINSPGDTSSSIYFVTAKIGLGVEFVAILGSKLPPAATINELTTVAAAYSMAQFYRTGEIRGDSFGLRLAAGMNDNIVSTATGDSSTVLLTSPNADESNSLRTTRSLANLLGACQRNLFVRMLFLRLTTSGNIFTSNTARALAHLARDPGRHAILIYLLTKVGDTYPVALEQHPDAWVVTVKVNDSGDDNYLFGGPGNVAFDSRGYAWIANNVVQGTPKSGKVLMVLQPNGKPAVGGPGLPTSPILGGGILGGGWGVTVDPFERVWTGNFGWGMVFPTAEPTDPDPNGSVSLISSAGVPLSQPIGFFGGSYRVQAIKSDAQGNIWMASFGNDSVVVFRNGDPQQSSVFQQYPHSGPFGVAIDAQGAAWISNSGGLEGEFPSSVAKYRLTAEGHIERDFLHFIGDTLRVIEVDSLGNAWVASVGDDTIYAYSPDGTLIGGFSGGGANGPWGLTVDGEDNIWVANFGQIAPGDFNNGGLSKFAGANSATRPPGTPLGKALSPHTGYTVHSAGQPVRLHDGTLLYGPGSLPVFVPLMRQTSLQIDQAGNMWTINNWKPRFFPDEFGIDADDDIALDGNPGGDGIVIFVGLAPPRAGR